MSLRFHRCHVFALIFLALGVSALSAEEPAPGGRATPTNNSPPQPDTVSSNLNKIGARGSPLTDLESSLKKPFEIFERGGTSDKLGPASSDMRYVPPAPVLSNKKLKELLDKRAEAMYLLPEDNESASATDDLLKNGKDPLDPSGQRPKSPLDRYYDRLDRTKLAPTNRTPSSLLLFGDKAGPDEEGDFKPKLAGGFFDNQLSITARSFGSKTNSTSGGGFLSPEGSKPRSYGDIFGLGPVETSSPADRARDTRLDDFKRLLNGPGYGSRNEFNVTPPPSASSAPSQASKPVGEVPGPTWLTTPQPVVGGTFGDAPGVAGAIGVPMGVPDFAKGTPSLTATPPIQKSTPRPPPPAYNVPRRRF